MKKYIAMSLLLMLISSQMVMTFAEVVIDRNTAIEMAISSSASKESLEDTTLDLHANMANLYRYAQQQKDAEENYSKMIETMTKMGLPIADEMIFNGEDEFNAFYSMQIQYASINAQYLALKDSLASVDLQIISGVDTLLTNLLYLKEMIVLQDNYIAVQEELLTDAETQYTLGLLSDNAYEDAKADYQIAVYEKQQFNYKEENLELQLKQMLGLSMGDDIVLSDDYMSPNTDLEPIEVYQTKALENRNDIKSARYQLDAAKSIYDYNMSAVSDLMNVFKANMAVEKAASDLEDTKIDVYKDILQAYNAVEDAEKTLEIAKKSYEVALAGQRQAQISYDQGLIKDTDLALAKFSAQNSLATLKSNIRTLYLAIETLNNKTVVQ